MFSDQVAEISLSHDGSSSSRCLDAIQADRTTCRFVSVTSSNDLHVMRFHSEMNEFSMDGVLDLPEEADTIASAPHDATLVVTASQSSSMATVYKIPHDVVTCEKDLDYKPQEEFEDEMENHHDAMLSSGGISSSTPSTLATIPSAEKEPLQQVATLPMPDRMAHVIWNGEDEFDPGSIVTLSQDGTLSKWNVEDTSRPLQTEKITLQHNHLTIPKCACDPHSLAQQHFCVTNGKHVQFFDWRIDTSVPSGVVSKLQNAHSMGGVTDVNYNPNKPNVIVTSGQDGLIKFWDLRFSHAKKHKPLLVGRGGHSHWVSCVKYNPFHDQLILSAGTDAFVNLWRMSSISSAPLLQFGSDINTTTATSSGNNIRVSTYEHSDSVHGMAWGAADAWVYATVGHDGKVVLNHVPSDEKYKILL